MNRVWKHAALRFTPLHTQARPIGRTAALVYLVCMAAFTGLTHAADDGDFRSGIVKIESTSVEGKSRKGTGFIVSMEDGVAFIMTAAHVVAGDKTPHIELFTHPLPVEASVARQDLQLDIALLVVRGSDKLFEGLQALPLGLGWQPSVGQQVTTIGFPAGLSWAVSKPNIASQEGVHLAVVGGNIDEGSSGGPVLDSNAVVGMVTIAQRGAGRAVPVQILALMLQGWRIDVNEGPSPPQGAAAVQPRSLDSDTGPGPMLTWERELGQTMAHEVHPTRDGNYILSGYTRQKGDKRAYDAIVAKLSRSGELIWQRSFPTGGDDDLIYSIAELPGGGYVVAGENGEDGAWIATLDENGKDQWERTFPQLTSTMIWRVRTSREGNIVFAGKARSAPESRSEIWIVQLDRRGDVLWTQRYWNPDWGDTGGATPFVFRPTADGGYVVAAVHGSWTGPIWILKLDAKGDLQWNRSVEREGNLFNVIEPKQGGYVFAGTVMTEDGRRGRIVKLNRDGRLVWDRGIDKVASKYFYGIAETADDGFLAVGESIVRLDDQGMLVSQEMLEQESMIIAIEPAPDGGYIAAGMKYDTVWVLKLDAEGSRSEAR